jgi:hypothetical protein
MNAPFRPPGPGRDPRQSLEMLIAYQEQLALRIKRGIRTMQLCIAFNLVLLSIIIFLQIGMIIRVWSLFFR